jgi:UDP-N-acetylglucosamine:LPS N-acetylglucosamine transferase
MKQWSGPVFIMASPGGHASQALIITERLGRRIFLSYSHLDKFRSEKGVEKVLRAFPVRTSVIGHVANFGLFAWYFLRYRPRALVSTGGPFCLPAFVIAKWVGVPCFYIDTLSRVEGFSNTCQMILDRKLASKVLTQWPHLADADKGVEYHGSIIALRHGGNNVAEIQQVA